MHIKSLTPALDELERALTWAAKPTGINGQHIVPTIQTKGKKSNCYGWFGVNRWSTREGTQCHEINFCAEHLNRDPIDIIATAIHETVHLWCYSLGLKDVAASGRHNKVFREYAGLLGLICADSSDSVGYGYTHASPELLERIEKEFIPDVSKFALFRNAQGRNPVKISKPSKWTCGCTNVRCQTKLVSTCDLCGNDFQLVD